MTVTNYSGWIQDGSPWHPANPVQALADACEKHGVTFGTIGDKSHLLANPPEDHTPYSHTPWPGPQPYPYVLAIDLMTTDPKIAQRIHDAKTSGRLPCLKYMNYTDANGNVQHVSWESTESQRASSDSGHIHLSFRTDHVLCGHATGFDPFVGSPAPTPPPIVHSGKDDMLTHWVDIQQGSNGSAVRIWQGILCGHGYMTSAEIDGDFGPDTKTKTEDFQRDKAITVDGIVGPQSLSMGIYDHDYTH